MNKFSKALFSKKVGWSERSAKIPTLTSFNDAYNHAKDGNINAAYDIMEWYRFCPSATNDTDREVLELICGAHSELFE